MEFMMGFEHGTRSEGRAPIDENWSTDRGGVVIWNHLIVIIYFGYDTHEEYVSASLCWSRYNWYRDWVRSFIIGREGRVYGNETYEGLLRMERRFDMMETLGLGVTLTDVYCRGVWSYGDESMTHKTGGRQHRLDYDELMVGLFTTSEEKGDRRIDKAIKVVWGGLVCKLVRDNGS
ncbi:hypothetical protein Tco_1301022 [Tanacetum coccineum]